MHLKINLSNQGNTNLVHQHSLVPFYFQLYYVSIISKEGTITPLLLRKEQLFRSYIYWPNWIQGKNKECKNLVRMLCNKYYHTKKALQLPSLTTTMFSMIFNIPVRCTWSKIHDFPYSCSYCSTFQNKCITAQIVDYVTDQKGKNYAST